MKDSPMKVALVTGATGGIGRAVATKLARDGFAVVVHYAGNVDRAQALVAEIKAGGGRAVAVRADVADAADVERLFAHGDGPAIFAVVACRKSDLRNWERQMREELAGTRRRIRRYLARLSR